MEVDVKDPKVWAGAILLLASTVGGGSLLGFTVEPQGMTDLRVENARLTAKVSSLEGEVTRAETRVDALEGIMAECQVLLGAARYHLENET